MKHEGGKRKAHRENSRLHPRNSPIPPTLLLTDTWVTQPPIALRINPEPACRATSGSRAPGSVTRRKIFQIPRRPSPPGAARLYNPHPPSAFTSPRHLKLPTARGSHTQTPRRDPIRPQGAGVRNLDHFVANLRFVVGVRCC
jgi:hypothetical protein